MGTIADKLNKLDETKNLLRQRLTEKGLDVSNENNFYNLADSIQNIQTGSTIKTASISIKSSVDPYITDKNFVFLIDDNMQFQKIPLTTYTPSEDPKVFVNITVPSIVLFQLYYKDSINIMSGGVESLFVDSSASQYTACFYVNNDCILNYYGF